MNNKLLNTMVKAQKRKTKEESTMLDAIKTIEKLQQQAMTKPVPTQQLPFWPSDKRAAPSVAFRSALFPATARKNREMVKRLEIYSVGGVIVQFTGERFDQTDLTVFLEILHRMRNRTESEFSGYELLKSLSKPDSASNYQWLYEVIHRLTAGTVDIRAPGYRYIGHLVESVMEIEKSKTYAMCINAKFARMFSSSWSSLNNIQRRALKSPTAMALHAYYSSHRSPGRHKRETLCQVVGIEGKNRFQTLRKAFDQMIAVGFLESWNEDDQGGIQVKVIHNSANHTDIAREQLPT